MKIQVGPVEKFADIPGTGLIEGPAWVPEDGHLYFVEIEAGWISRITPDGSYEQFFDIGAPDDLLGPNGMIYDEKGKNLLIAHRDKGIVSLDPKTKELTVIVGDYHGKKFNGPNDLIIDSSGNLYFSDPWGTSVSNRIGVVYRVDGETGEIIPFMENLAFPNGVLISPDGQYIYVVEFGTNRLLRAMLLDGGKSHVFLHSFTYFTGGFGVDSMGMDVAGNLYIASFGSGRVFVVEPIRGDIIETIEFPGLGTDNARFGGPENKTLFVTDGLEKVIWKVEVAIPGMPIPQPPPASC